ncbi:MAG: carboxypeptidase regulatory-like domain-containing protein [Candidatus Edwardsbacteria bacterium]
MKRKNLTLLISWLLGFFVLFSPPIVSATRTNFEAGAGLLRVKSAKVSPGLKFHFFSLNFFNQMQIPYYGSDSAYADKRGDLWTYQQLSFTLSDHLEFLLTALGHSEKWSLQTTSTRRNTGDKTLGCPGDALFGVKVHLPISSKLFDLAIEPLVSIPVKGKNKIIDSPSQTGGLDFGGKVLADLNLKTLNIYLNAGYLNRANKINEVPAGLGIEYLPARFISIFSELTGEKKLEKVSYSEARITPGLRISPNKLFSADLGLDLGVFKADPYRYIPAWQIALGLAFPSRLIQWERMPVLGIIAGMVRDRETKNPLKSLITFPGTTIPGIVSDNEGAYKVSIPPGEYTIHVYSNGYRWLERKLKVNAGETVPVDVTLRRKAPPQGTLKGRVVSASTGNPVVATIVFPGTTLSSLLSEAQTGAYSVNLDPGTYMAMVVADGYMPQSIPVIIAENTVTNQNFQLTQAGTAVIPVVERPIASRTPTATPARPKPVVPTPPKPTPPKASPEEIANLYREGVRLYLSEDYEKALATFQKVIKLDPTNAKAKDYLSKTRARLKALKGG